MLCMVCHWFVVLEQGVEKTILSKMLVEGSNKRTYALDRHAGVVRVQPALARDPSKLHGLWHGAENIRMTAQLFAARRWLEWLLTAGRW